MDSACSTPSSSRSLAVCAQRRPREARRHHSQSLSHSHTSQPSASGTARLAPSVHSLQPGQSYVTVHTLTKETLTVTVGPKTRVHDVFWTCCEHLEVNDDRLFGLALRSPSEGLGSETPRHEYFFLDPALKMSKYAPKQPRFSSWNASKTESRPLVVLYFRVRVYIHEVRHINCPRALEHYYIQLRENLLDQWSGRNSVSEERCWEMAALALKVDKGENHSGYFRAEQYFPLWVLHLRGLDYVRANMPAVSCDLHHLTRLEAMQQFCQMASRSPFALNCHLYGLRRHKMDSVDNAVIGITAKGIEMCDIAEDGERIPLKDMRWEAMNRLSFDRKRLSIVGVDGVKLCLYAQSEQKARYLLELCRAVHQAILVVKHQTRLLPPPAPPKEMSVDAESNASTSGVGTAGAGSTVGAEEKDNDSLLQESLRAGSSVTKSKSSFTSITEVNERRELSSNERVNSSQRHSAASSDRSMNSTVGAWMGGALKGRAATVAGGEERVLPPPLDTPVAARPSSVDSASQTVDVNFNSKMGQSSQSLVDQMSPLHVSFPAEIPFSSELPYPDSGYPALPYSGVQSRSDSLMQSNELISEVLAGLPVWRHQPSGRSDEYEQYTSSVQQGSSSAEAALPSSISLHDLRTAGRNAQREPPRYNDSMLQVEAPSCSTSHREHSPKPRWRTVAGLSPQERGNIEQYMAAVHSSQARSEPKIDNIGYLPCSDPPRTQGLFDKNTRACTRPVPVASRPQGAAINRVHSMPAHYHSPLLVQQQQQRVEKEAATPAAAPAPASKAPPSYERALEMQRNQPIGSEAAGQPSFPPASAATYEMEEEALNTGRLRDFPLMRALWAEQTAQQPATAIQRRPSSCLDLTSDCVPQLYSPLAAHRGDYFLACPSPSIHTITMQQRQQSSMWRSTAALSSVAEPTVALPPPPPYPSSPQRKAPMVM